MGRALSAITSISGVVVLIWLAVLGRWDVILRGFLLVAVSGVLLPICLAAATGIFSGPGVVLLENGKQRLGIFLIVLGCLVTYAISSAWCCLVIAAALEMTREPDKIPLLIFAHGCATAPFSWMAAKELQSGSSSQSSSLHSFATSTSLAVAVLALLAFNASYPLAMKLFLGCMVVTFVASLFFLDLSRDQ